MKRQVITQSSIVEEAAAVCLFVVFQQIIDYKNKAIQRRGVEANGAMALQPVEAPGYDCR